MENERRIYTKSIHKPLSNKDGFRISVMSRHTLNDGVTPDPLITGDTFNRWWKTLAPPDQLVVAYYRRNLPWANFERSYLNFLRHEERRLQILEMIKLTSIYDLTLLCVEDNPEQCHRRLLAEECQRLDPNLKIVID